jgi:hypothetical protein
MTHAGPVFFSPMMRLSRRLLIAFAGAIALGAGMLMVCAPASGASPLRFLDGLSPPRPPFALPV